MNETCRRIVLWTVSLGGWGYAVGMAIWATLEYDPQHGRFAPQWMTLSVFLSMGFALAAGVAVGRINSVRTLSRIFDAGMLAQEVRDAKRDKRDEKEPVK